VYEVGRLFVNNKTASDCQPALDEQKSGPASPEPLKDIND